MTGKEMGLSMRPVRTPGNPTSGGRSSAPRNLIATVTATTLLGASAFIGLGPAGTVLPAAHALPLPLEPDDPVVADQWINPFARADDQIHDVELEITDIPLTGALTAGDDLVLELKISNNTSDELDQVTLLAQRGNAATDNATARMALASDGSGSYPYYGTQLVLDEQIAPGESATTTMRVPTDVAESVTLAITGPGAYPVRIALSGQLDGTASHLDSQRFLLPVVTPAPEPAPVTGEEEPPAPTPTTVVYPFTAETHVLGGETGEAPETPPLLLESDELAGELAPGGRLTELVDAFLSAPTPVQEASCLALDPALISVVHRMTGGYTVTDQRVSAVRQNQRLRDLWTATNEPATGTPGTGAADATVFLDKLRQAVATNCTVAMPWSNTDLNAVNSTGNQWLLREAVQRGGAVIEDILGVTPVGNVVIPGTGYVTPATAGNLGLADTLSREMSLEQMWEVESVTPIPATGPSGQASLDNPELPATDTTAPPPEIPVSVLVADNTVWRTPSADRFHQLAPGVTAVSYQGSLAATLATLGSSPETAGFSNPDARFDVTLDSATARTLSGQSALRLTVGNNEDESPVLVMPPAVLEGGDAKMLLDTTADLIDSGVARPMTLPDYLTADAGQQAELAESVTSNGMPDETSFGAPFADPSQVADTEILRATQQATYIDDLTGLMFNDQGIALTRYGFTAPLRQDLLRAMTVTHRRSYTDHTEATAAAEALLNQNRDMLQQLRSSVALLPPGNVYTRTSASSPLIIVAQNGLPLPAAAQILYTSPDNARVHTPGVVRIPASGSITLQMTADLPDDNQRTDLTVWLASPDGATISDPVEISVLPRPSVLSTVGIVALGILVLGALLVFRVLRMRKRKGRASHGGPPGPPASPGDGHRTGERPAPHGVVRPTKPGSVGEGRRQATRYVPRGRGCADDGSGSPKPPGAH
ncbi:hypothetical protein HMPREF0290_2754 [Corynebacterium efficiens YS-314]|uniref:Secreted protein n=1 Tax=Corynebacterium efficiens (strain DSM 44549 / YS-314 / AJ 12310 / JCM 11189 / NBRC 100395) TaxID=196164 RepID=Q8FSW4_COREF|nr:hypothetical protein HMPREF0290_2754 [Corynebacterium efficiens YS-314]BAC19740.1 conserved hypothetical protein [Corynebacterium efficiens YS-314]